MTPTTLCVTKGRTIVEPHIEVPTFRAVAPGHAGDAASLKVIVHGTSKTERALSSGEMRRQVGLKLRAQNGCNLVYVMWRLDPKPKIDVSVKMNPGMTTAKECGASGYTKVRPIGSTMLPVLEDGTEHELRAEIAGDSLLAWVDGQLAWQGILPMTARDLTGPAGVRSDNLEYDLTSFSVDTRLDALTRPKCIGDQALNGHGHGHVSGVDADDIEQTEDSD